MASLWQHQPRAHPTLPDSGDTTEKVTMPDSLTLIRTPAGPVLTIWRSLPGRAVSAAAFVNGTLWLIVDPNKTDGFGSCVTQLLVS